MAGYIGSKAVNLSTTGADINGNANIDGNLSFGDNDKAIFGAGSDLQIYHDGSNSFISDQGTGNLKILADDFRIRNAADTASYIFITSGAEVGLTYNGATKLATTATGVDITGVLSSNKVTIDNGLADGGELLLASQGYNSWQLDNSSGSVRFIYDGKVPYQINGPSDAFIWRSSTSANTERMRIDASGNVGIGTTADQQSSAVNEGIWFSYGSSSSFSANATPLIINRMGTGGNNRANITLHNNGTARADIGTLGASNGLYIEPASSGNGLAYLNTSVSPCQGGGAVSDNYLDLGTSSRRFDDIYATNGTIQTSDRNEKQDIAELSDAEQRVAVAAKGLLRKFRWRDAVEAKGDDARTHFGIIAQDLQAAFAAEGLDAGDYAMFISSTWTDEETGEERTRMGVRYSELLAFIIGAL